MWNFFVTFATLIFAAAETVAGWSYNDQGSWPGMCKTGKKQSPIAIDVQKAMEKSYPPFIFDHYDREYQAVVKNNGHSVEFRLTTPVDLLLSGGGLAYEYKLDHLHFHWPSEHTIDERRYPLELHLVHYSSKFKNLTEAIDVVNGIAVIGVLFEESPEEDYFLKPVVEAIRKVGSPSDSMPISINPRTFLPRDTAGFYRYEGSLTTPGCNQGLIWTIFTETIHMSLKQLESYKTVKLSDASKTNYRAVQNENGRTVYWKKSPSSASTMNAFAISSLLGFMVLLKNL